MKILILQLFMFIVCFAAYGCNCNGNNNKSYDDNSTTAGNRFLDSSLHQLNYNNSNIVGNWCLDSSLLHQLNYPKITFLKNSTAVLSSRMDTVYVYIYYLHGNSIYFKTNTNVNEFRIIKLTHDRVVFKNLFENTVEQIYYRCD